MAQQFTAAGLERIYYGFENSDGILIGNGATLAAGSVGTMGRITGAQSFSLNIPESPRQTVTGDDSALVQFIFNATDLGSGSLTMSTADMILATRGISLDVVNEGGKDAFAINPDVITRKNVWFIINSTAKSVSSATFGNTGYEVTFVRCQLTYRGRSGWSTQELTDYQYDLALSPFSKFPWGAAVSAGSNATTVAAYTIFSPNKLTMDTFAANASATTFALAGTAQNVGASPNGLRAWKNIDSSGYSATELTYTTDTASTGEFSFATGTVTLGDSAYASGDFVHTLYEVL